MLFFVPYDTKGGNPMNVVIDWESRDTHEVAQLPNVYPGDRVRVMGWKGIHTVVKRPWFHKVLQGYITEVETETGRRVKMLVDELSQFIVQPPTAQPTLVQSLRKRRPDQCWYSTHPHQSPCAKPPRCHPRQEGRRRYCRIQGRN